MSKLFLFRSAILSTKLIGVVVSLGLLTLLTYFFEFFLLRGPLNGNDAANVYQVITFMDKFWPNVPVWNPLQGAGVSFTQGYPTLYHHAVILLSRVFDVNLLQSMALVNFLTILLTSFGVYFLVLWRFKNQTAALIAGVFLLLSPMINIWIDGAGFLAQTFSYIFVAPALAFFDGFLGATRSNNQPIRKAVFLVGTIFFSALATLAHPSTAVGLFVTFVLYTSLYSLLIKPNSSRLGNLFKNLKALFVLVLLWGLAVAFWVIPFYRYTGISNKGFNFFSSDPKTFAPVDFLPTLGFHKPDTQYAFPDLSLTMVVTALALVCLLISYFYSKRIFILSLLTFWNLFLIGTLIPVKFLTKVFPQFVPFIDMRTAVPIVMVIAPIVAAFGAVFLAKSLLKIIPTLFKYKPQHLLAKELVAPFLVSVFALLIALGGIWFFNDKTAFKKSDQGIYYGPLVRGFNINHPWIGQAGFKDRCSDTDNSLLCTYPAVLEKIDINTFSYFCDQYAKLKDRFWMCTGSKPPKGEPITESDVNAFIQMCEESKNLSQQFKDLCLASHTTLSDKYNPKNWPSVFINGEDKITPDVQTTVDKFKDVIGTDVQRVDVSPSYGTLVKTFGLQQDVSMINIYTGQLILSKPFSGVLRSTLSTEGNIIEGRLSEIAKWYGLEGVYLNASDKQEQYEKSGWEKSRIGGGFLWHPEESFGVASIGKKPFALAIGNFKSNTYQHIFKGASGGGLPYDDFWLVEGKEKIDNYSLKQLQEYQLLILHGYSYGSKSKAWKLLDDYVNSGGLVFIDTGWQFIDKDWGEGDDKGGFKEIELPEPAPVSKTLWGNIGNKWEGVSVNEGLVDQADLDKFALPAWEGRPWGMSLASKKDLRDNSQEILSKDGKVLLAARKVGKGKIVWSGINLFPHVVDNDKQEEYKFLGSVFSWLSSDLEPGEETKASYQRHNPDKVVFDLKPEDSQSAIYWKEFNFPDWQANINAGGKRDTLEVLSAGPRMSLIKIPEFTADAQITFEYRKPFLILFGQLLSLATVLGLLVFLLDQYIFKARFTTSIGNKVRKLVGSPFSRRINKIKENFDREEDD